MGASLNKNEWDSIICSLEDLSLNCEPSEILAVRALNPDFDLPIEELLETSFESVFEVVLAIATNND